MWVNRLAYTEARFTRIYATLADFTYLVCKLPEYSAVLIEGDVCPSLCV